MKLKCNDAAPPHKNSSWFIRQHQLTKYMMCKYSIFTSYTFIEQYYNMINEFSELFSPLAVCWALGALIQFRLNVFNLINISHIYIEHRTMYNCNFNYYYPQLTHLQFWCFYVLFEGFARDFWAKCWKEKIYLKLFSGSVIKIDSGWECENVRRLNGYLLFKSTNNNSIFHKIW